MGNHNVFSLINAHNEDSSLDLSTLLMGNKFNMNCISNTESLLLTIALLVLQ